MFWYFEKTPQPLLAGTEPNPKVMNPPVLVPLRVLLVEDSIDDAALIVDELRCAGFDPKWKRVEVEKDYRAGLREAPEIILSDFALPQFSTLRALALLQEENCGKAKSER